MLSSTKLCASPSKVEHQRHPFITWWLHYHFSVPSGKWRHLLTNLTSYWVFNGNQQSPAPSYSSLMTKQKRQNTWKRFKSIKLIYTTFYEFLWSLISWIYFMSLSISCPSSHVILSSPLSFSSALWLSLHRCYHTALQPHWCKLTCEI